MLLRFAHGPLLLPLLLLLLLGLHPGRGRQAVGVLVMLQLPYCPWVVPPGLPEFVL